MHDAESNIDWPAAIEQHRPWLRKILRCRVRDAHAVDDLLQDVAVAVLKQPSRPVDPQFVAPWLYRLTVRQAINFHRRAGRKSHAKPSDVVNHTLEENDPLEWIMQQEQRTAMQNAMQRLRPQDREILTLKYTENWNYKQLAKHLGVKPRTIEYRLLKARKQLRSLLTQSVSSATIKAK